MKNLSLLLFSFFLMNTVLAQDIPNLSEMQPPAEYDNIHVEKLSSDERASCFVIWVKEKVAAHRHETHSESVYVLEGTGTMTLGDRSFTFKKGDYIYIPINTVHAVEVTSENAVQVLSIQAPEFLGKDRVFQED